MDQTTITIGSVQLNPKQCFTEKAFYNYIEKIFQKSEADVLIFPEDISFCLAWVKEESFEIQSIKSKIENLSSFILSRLNLNKMGRWISDPKIERIIRRTFSSLSEKYNKVVVAGSIYVQRSNGRFNSSLVFDHGKYVGEYLKQNLVPLEISWGIESNNDIEPILTCKGNIGICICYDLNDPKVCKELTEKGADYIVAPSSGWRPYPWYPFDESTEMPQLQRAKENNITIFRPYCCGFLFPGLYFQGHTTIVDKDGVKLKSKSKNKQEILNYKINVNS